jgi:N-formylglutamate deformylase
MVKSFVITPPTVQEVPVVISVPHCGVAFPDEIKGQFKEELIQVPDDTDWFVDRLYEFAPSMGATMIKAVHSRWVIDLNRDPTGTPLYHDGRIITNLCPTTTFLGQPLYKDQRQEIDSPEVERRVREYFQPYHNKVQELLDELRQKFGRVLLWDCHSIRQYVPTIQKERFPDLILGSADGKSASAEIVETALKNLGSSGYGLSHNSPFKGGFITRYFGRPEENQHALQLEMNKVNYMDDTETKYDEVRAEKIRNTLKKTLLALTKKFSG